MTVGIPDTAMPAFGLVPEEDRWAIAFYLFTLRTPPCEGARPSVELAALSVSTDVDLIRRFGEEKLGCLRLSAAP